MIITFDGLSLGKILGLNSNSHDYWKDKKIVWFGTSIPATNLVSAKGEKILDSYPIIVGNMLGATVYNEALGSSAVRIGIHGSISENDPKGFSGAPAICVLYSLSMTKAEKKEILDNWDYYKIMFKKSADMIDPKQYDKYLNSSYESKLDRYLAGGDIGNVDFYIFDHGYNDAGYGNGCNYEDITDIPNDYMDRTYFIGAMNFLFDRILTANPKAQIVIIGHYNDEVPFDQLVEAQRYLADKWNIPFIETWKNMGFSSSVSISINGQSKTMKDVWIPDGIHPSSDKAGD